MLFFHLFIYYQLVSPVRPHFLPDPISSLPQIDYSARRIAQGKFLNAGQSCAAPDYLLVDRKIKKETRYISPTIIDNITQDDPIMQEEIFGFSYRLGKQVLFFLGQEVFHHPDFCLY